MLFLPTESRGNQDQMRARQISNKWKLLIDLFCETELSAQVNKQIFVRKFVDCRFCRDRTQKTINLDSSNGIMGHRQFKYVIFILNCLAQPTYYWHSSRTSQGQLQVGKYLRIIRTQLNFTKTPKQNRTKLRKKKKITQKSMRFISLNPGLKFMNYGHLKMIHYSGGPLFGI